MYRSPRSPAPLLAVAGIALLAASCTIPTTQSMYDSGSDGGAMNLALAASDPPAGSTGAPLGTAIVMTFNEFPDPASLGTFGALLLRSGANSYDYDATVDLPTRSVVMQPRSALAADTQYAVQITTMLAAIGGGTTTATTFQFTTGQTAGGAPAAPIKRSLATDVQPLFDASCLVGCHDATLSGGLDLRAAAASSALLGVPSGEEPSLDRVAPGKPSESYLIRKLVGSPDVLPYAQMPLGSTWPIDDIRIVSDWIATGAGP